MIEDLYDILIIIPSTGYRIKLEQVEVKIDPKQEVYDHKTPFGATDYQMVKKSWLDIMVTIRNPEAIDLLTKMKKQFFHEYILMNIIDVHPNLIRCMMVDGEATYRNLKLNFEGNTTDKTLEDFAEEAAIQLNKMQEVVIQSKIDDMINGKDIKLESVEKEIKIKKLKRKLTF